MGKKIKVLVIDDSALVRNILTRGLSMDPEIEVVGAAGDPFKARDMIVQLRPDVLTLDVEMPRMDGLEFLKRLMPQYPLPVIMVSALTRRGAEITLDALASGAIDFVPKPAVNIAEGLTQMMLELREKIIMASKVDVSNWKKADVKQKKVFREKRKALAESTDKVIAIGASTGGTEAIKEVIMDLPYDMPGIVVVQHMPSGFTRMFADRLNELCAMDVKEAETGDRVMTGKVLIAPGGYHMALVRSGGIYRVACREGEPVSGHMPSVDYLFDTVATHAGANAVGVILTGMGRDGAEGMLKMRQAGARTIAQDEASSVVFGMPKEAYALGGAESLVPLSKISSAIRKLIEK